MERYIIENQYLIVEFLAYGGCITKIVNKKTKTNYILAYDRYIDYKRNPYYLGAVIGRNAGRTFPPHYIDYRGKSVSLDTNEKNVHLHGGRDGFHKKQFRVEKKSQESYNLSLVDDRSLYEAMVFNISYRLRKNVFIIEITGVSEVPTICNLTNHMYFNLDDEKASVGKHLLKIADAKLQLIDEQYIPAGDLIDYASEPMYKGFDFSNTKEIESAFNQNNLLSMICNGGIDLAYCFKPNCWKNQHPLISLSNASKTNRLQITSNQNSVVVYTLNKLSDVVSIDKRPVMKHQGITFELQQIPNFIHGTSDYLTKKYESITEYAIL
ncbi:hypothetical protein [Enterococcus innesii]|uniref:aldose epimerase family protein n=1 Tax=Enterococcus innesii TaxID=2839759 RepID=UPI00209141E9|nr:hypothetical protein [Enterococcus innesii]MCO5497898.1 hypothetical protein [Enterococcus innesii]